MWHEYPIPTDFENQKRIIRALREWIQQLEADNLISGFAFNHYSSNPEVPDQLRVRFQYSAEHNRQGVENQLETEVKEMLPSYVMQEREWGSDTTDRHVLQAYELGSRWSFLAWELIEKGRFPAEYFTRAEFQFHFNHGVMNSLGIPKIPDELNIHINNIMDATNSRTKESLIRWLQEHLT
jgi:hypothetical protein